MGSAVSESARRRVGHAQVLLEQAARGYPSRAHLEVGNNHAMKLGIVVGYGEIGLKRVAENCVEMRKLDRKRALRVSREDSDEWRAFAIDALSTALEKMKLTIDTTAQNLAIDGAVAYEA